jgi:hypothetical protein
MPRGPAPAWRARKPPVADPYILAIVEQAGGLGKFDPQTGFYGTGVLRGLADRDEASEWKRSLFRCAVWLNKNRIKPHGISISQADIERDGEEWKLIFRVSDKTYARKHMLETHGSDRSQWSYDPRRRGGT